MYVSVFLSVSSVYSYKPKVMYTFISFKFNGPFLDMSVYGQ